MDVIGHHLHPQHPIAIALLLLQHQFIQPGIQRGMEDFAPVFRVEDHVILTTVDGGMIGVVLLGRLFNIHNLPLSLVTMLNSNICGKLMPVKKGFGLKAKEAGPLSWPSSADAVAPNSPYIPSFKGLGSTGPLSRIQPSGADVLPAALSLSHDGTSHQVLLVPVPSSFEAAFSKGRTAPEVTLRGTMGPLRDFP
jgi:hypothetical protein